ncbi:hypothetical protein [Halobacteriovorax sp. HLS]|uniref:hypothetical protein n=1 Tax=Halobacteriovorax sp. HLS TaxID=2234000 RepID=UPI000FD7C438|nr:hypothetical protein [Halobacteriovorax sp. HLS]
MWKKISSVVVLGLLLVTYNHCGMPAASKKKSDLTFSHPDDISVSNSGIVSTATGDDVEFFSNTVWQITKNRCASCHGSLQQPLHASSDVNTAYDAIINSYKVNFTNPENSRMVLKLKDENHNCWSNCADNSNEILSEIEQWIAMRDSANVTPIDDEASSNSSMTTNESLTLDQSLNAGGNTGLIKLQPGAAMLQAPMTRGQSGDIEYLYVGGTGVNKNVNDPTAGMAFINFSSMKTATYKMWAYVDAKANSDDSFFIRLNNGNYAQWHIPATNGFEWREVTTTTNRNPMNFFMPQGDSNRLEIRQREDGTKISTVILTDDFNQSPTTFDLGTSVTFSYDISAMVGLNSGSVRLEVECREFDEYTYQFFNPKIISNRNIRVKGMKLLINGNYNPQHATYNFVDKVVGPADSSVSSSSLLAIKENGNTADRFSFSFEVLELQ